MRTNNPLRPAPKPGCRAVGGPEGPTHCGPRRTPHRGFRRSYRGRFGPVSDQFQGWRAEGEVAAAASVIALIGGCDFGFEVLTTVEDAEDRHNQTGGVDAEGDGNPPAITDGPQAG